MASKIVEREDPQDRPLSAADREAIFRMATSGFYRQYQEDIAVGMSDGKLWRALQVSLGIFGGSSSPGGYSIVYQGAGLKIWGGHCVVNHVTTRPLFSNQATIDMAREIYKIRNPDADQLSLF